MVLRRPLAVGFVVLAASVGAFAQPATDKPAAGYEPSVGQPGKDVVWVPTPQVLVDRMLDMAKVTRDDYVIDLGSGDGRLVITAAKRGARALGIEYEGEMVALSRRNAQREGVADRAEFVRQDLFDADLSKATVITMFLLPSINRRLLPLLLTLKPGTRLVSNTFPLGDWKPDATAELSFENGCESTYCTALFWVVPASVVGRHSTPHGVLTVDRQAYQMFSGSLKTEGSTIPVQGRVTGESVELRAGARELRGRVVGRRLELP